MAKLSAYYSTTDAPLYLKKVTLENIRCFEKLEIDLTAPGKRPRMWGVVLGDNGVGKTTLLRCIAIGLCDEASAAGLLREIYGELIREGGPNDTNSKRGARIRVEFFPNEEADHISVTTLISPSSGGYSTVRQKAIYGKQRSDFPWDRVFACGYGAGRRGFGSKDIDDYATLDAVYTLFNYDVPLQNPELVLRRIAALKNPGSTLQAVLDSIAEVLQLEPADIQLSETGLLIRGPWGKFHPIRGLGDGFQATLAWIVDFLGWAIFYDGNNDLSDLSGIVLIDELEQHLHPRWQRRIVGLLSSHFPKVQFIATTHTPMCAVGTAELSAGSCELILLTRDGSQVTAVQDIEPPRRMRADQVLTSVLFGLATTTSDDLTQDVARYAQLRGKKNPSTKEKEEASQLFDRLQQQLTSSETTLETEVSKEVSKALKKIRGKSFDANAVNFEVIRQLRKLASS